MGTSLTGLTPATTYDALIKVGDNGPLSATAKYLSDGLGNDSVLALSTGFVGIGTTSAVGSRMELAIGGNAAGSAIQLGRGGTNKATIQLDSGDVLSIENNGAFPISFATNAAESMRITPAGNVGIGTTTPNAKLTVVGTGEYDGLLIVRSTGSGTPQAALGVDAVGSGVGYVGTVNNIPLQIRTNDVTRLRVDADGLKFGSDTAAANALDDYEEGTWTPVLSFGFGDTGLTYNSRSGTYTKIGRKVTLNGYISVSNKGTSTGACRIGAFPFTCANGDSFLSAISMWLNTISFTGQYQGLVRPNTNYSDLGNVSEAGTFATLTDTNFTTNSEIIMCITYFV